MDEQSSHLFDSVVPVSIEDDPYRSLTDQLHMLSAIYPTDGKAGSGRKHTQRDGHHSFAFESQDLENDGV